MKKLLPIYSGMSYLFWTTVFLLVAPASVAAQSIEEYMQEPSLEDLIGEEATEASPNMEVFAGETMTTLEQIRAQDLAPGSKASPASAPMAQVTSVTQFSDVQPGDWAYEALAFLANSSELGGLDCLEGYPK